MKEVLQNVRNADHRLLPDEDAECDVCGRPGAYHFGDRLVCQDCYAGCGSCCPEFGRDDLWEFADDAA